MKTKEWGRRLLAACLAVSLFAGCGSAESAARSEMPEKSEEHALPRAGEAEPDTGKGGERGAMPQSGETEIAEGEAEVKSTAEAADRAAVSEADLVAYRLADVPDPDFAPYPDEALLADGGDWEEYNKLFDAWWTEHAERQKFYDNNVGALYNYYRAAVPVFLRDDGETNAVCSPLNIWLALSLLAEATDGQTREQLVRLLEGDVAQVDVLRTDDAGRALKGWEWRASRLMVANSVDDGAVTSRIGNSLWLRDGGAYRADTLQKLAKDFRAETFSGDMVDEGYSRALQAWLDLRTGGLLSEQAAGVSFDPQTMLALASTLYYKASWAEKFDPAMTTKEIFHAPTGDRQVEMMRGAESMDYLRGEHFAMTSLDLMYSGRMFLFLPDKGVTPGELLDDPRVLAELCGMTTDDRKGRAVRVSLPKFDIADSVDLTDGMRALGIEDVFSENADFSPIAEGSELALSSALHAARVVADEEGVLGAAFTVMMTEDAALEPEEPLEMVFDRPFLFAVTAEDGSVLFMGIVNEP